MRYRDVYYASTSAFINVHQYFLPTCLYSFVPLYSPAFLKNIVSLVLRIFLYLETVKSNTYWLKAWSDRQTDLLRREKGQNMQNLTKFISSDACHIMTVHQMGVSVHFVRWKVLNMLKSSNRTKRTSPAIARQG